MTHQSQASANCPRLAPISQHRLEQNGFLLASQNIEPPAHPSRTTDDADEIAHQPGATGEDLRQHAAHTEQHHRADLGITLVTQYDFRDTALHRLDEKRKREEARFRERQAELDREMAERQAAYVAGRRDATAAVVAARQAYRKAGGKD